MSAAEFVLRPIVKKSITISSYNLHQNIRKIEIREVVILVLESVLDLQRYFNASQRLQMGRKFVGATAGDIFLILC